MVKNVKIDNDEINLIDLIYTAWEGKWKIVVTVVISLIAATIYQSINKNNFTAISEIKPIGTLKSNKFLVFNNLIESTNNANNTINTDNDNFDTDDNTRVRVNNSGKINKITSLRLLNSYINILNERSVFEDAIHKFNILDASQYENEQEYSEAIIRLASSIKILSPSDSKKKNEFTYSTINFAYNDAKKWKSVLTYVDEITNKLVKKTLVDEYNNIVTFLTDKQMYQLQDISIKIDNYLIDYEREILDRVAYLNEQSAIAKTLGIAKNTIEVQTFGNQNALLSNIKTDSPFYLRGYEAIDKEIELIQSRTNKKAFIKGLFDLEKKKRAIEQDETIERFKLVLQSNVLVDNIEFSAASINAITTNFEYKDNKKMFVLAIFIGLMVGIFYVLISNSFQSFRVSKKKKLIKPTF